MFKSRRQVFCLLFPKLLVVFISFSAFTCHFRFISSLHVQFHTCSYIFLCIVVALLQGYDWVGWSNDSSAVRAIGGVVQMTFRFDAIRNFTSTRLRANNMRSRDVAVFSRALPSLSLDGRSYKSLDPFVTPDDHDGSQSARDVVIPLGGAVGRFVRLRLEFAAHWMLISEVEFTSGM